MLMIRIAIDVALHLAAACKNYSMIRPEPFQHPLRLWAIIVARIDTGLWIAALVAIAVLVSRSGSRHPHSDLDFMICSARVRDLLHSASLGCH